MSRQDDNNNPRKTGRDGDNSSIQDLNTQDSKRQRTDAEQSTQEPDWDKMKKDLLNKIEAVERLQAAQHYQPTQTSNIDRYSLSGFNRRLTGSDSREASTEIEQELTGRAATLLASVVTLNPKTNRLIRITRNNIDHHINECKTHYHEEKTRLLEMAAPGTTLSSIEVTPTKGLSTDAFKKIRAAVSDNNTEELTKAINEVKKESKISETDKLTLNGTQYTVLNAMAAKAKDPAIQQIIKDNIIQHAAARHILS